MPWHFVTRSFVLIFFLNYCQVNLEEYIAQEEYAGKRKGLILVANQTVAEKDTNTTQFQVFFNLEGTKRDVTQEAKFTVTNPEILNVGQTGIGFALEVGTAEVYAEYQGMKSNVIPFTVIHQAALYIVEAKSIDINQNGLLDGVYLRFNKKVRDATLNLIAWQAKVVNANELVFPLANLFYPQDDYIDDEILHITFAENKFITTGAQIKINFQAGAIFDFSGNSLAMPEIFLHDRAPPVLLWAKVSENSKQILLNFSEVIFPENMQCEGNDFVSLTGNAGMVVQKNGNGVSLENISLYCLGSLVLLKASESITSTDTVEVRLTNPPLVDEQGNFALSLVKAVDIIPQGGYFIRPHLTGNAQHGAHSVLIPHGVYAGKYLVILGNASTKTSLYDPFTGSFEEGPELTFLAYVGSHSFVLREGPRRYDLVTVLGSGNRTNYYNMATGTFREGPKLTTVAFTGASSRYISSGVHKGKEFLVLGFKTKKTNFFNPLTLSFSEGPDLTGDTGLGSLILTLNGGDLLILHGENSNTASLFDATSGLVSPASLSLPPIKAGSLYIRLRSGSQSGNYLVLAGSSNQSFFLNPTTRQVFTGPTLSSFPLPGSAIANFSPNEDLVFLGSGKNTLLYDENTNTFSTFLQTKVSLGIGAHTLTPQFGKYAGDILVVAGGNSTALDALDPTTPINFTTGPALVAHAYLGSHSIAIKNGPHQGKFLVIHGAGTATSIFDPSTEEFTPGPSLPQPAYDGAHSMEIPVGMHAGKFLVILGNQSNKSAIYDPNTNTVISGPDLTGIVGEGGTSIVIPSGPYAGAILTFHGGGLNTSSIYNPFLNQFLAGPSLTYSGSDVPLFGGSHLYLVDGGIHNGKIALVIGGTNAVIIINPASTNVDAILYQTGTAYQGAHTVKIEWGIHAGRYLSIHGAGNGINLFDPENLEFSRVKNSEGENQFLTDLAYIGAHTVKIPSGVHAGKYMIVHAFYSKKTSLFDPMTGNITPGPELAMPAGDGAHSIVYGTKILTIHGSGNGTSKYQDSSGSYFAGPSLSFTSFEGSHSIKIPYSDDYLLIHGAGTSTSIFEAALGSYMAGKALPTNAYSGSHSVELTSGVHSGKILTFHGVNSRKVSLFNPSLRDFMVGPDLPQNLSPGGYSFRLGNGNVLVLHGYNVKTTSVYNASSNSFSSGPDLTDKIYPGSHAIKLESGPHSGKFLIWHCASLSSSLYDESSNSFSPGPSLPLPCSEGAHSIKIPSGPHANKYLVFLSGGRNTAIYDPSTNGVSSGPLLVHPIYSGSHSFLIDSGIHAGKIINIAGNGQDQTNLYDPNTNSFSQGPKLEGKAFVGAHSFKVTSGPYSGKILTVLGGGKPGINVYLP